MQTWALCFTSLLFIFSSTVTAESKIYHWVDEDGKNHFSDTAGPEMWTEEVNVRNQNLLINDQEQVENNQDLGLEIAIEPEQQPSAIFYEADIVSPSDDSTIHSNDGALNIQVQITPEQKNDHQFQLYLDGQILGEPQHSATIRALNIARGTHQIQVFLLSKSGQQLAKTQIVTVHVQRATVNRAN